MKSNRIFFISWCILLIGLSLTFIGYLFMSINKNSLIMETRALPYIGKHVVMGKDTLKILYYDPSWDDAVLENGRSVSIKFLEASKILDNVESPR